LKKGIHKKTTAIKDSENKTFVPEFTSQASFDPTKLFGVNYLLESPQDRDILDNWSFDVTKIENPHQKSRLVWVVLKDLNLLDTFKIDPNILCNFISDIREKYDYRGNPFHNYDHGISGKIDLENLLFS